MNQNITNDDGEYQPLIWLFSFYLRCSSDAMTEEQYKKWFDASKQGKPKFECGRVVLHILFHKNSIRYKIRTFKISNKKHFQGNIFDIFIKFSNKFQNIHPRDNADHLSE